MASNICSTMTIRCEESHAPPVLRTLRNTGLNATNRLAPLKKLLMQHAFI